MIFGMMVPQTRGVEACQWCDEDATFEIVKDGPAAISPESHIGSKVCPEHDDHVRRFGYETKPLKGVVPPD